MYKRANTKFIESTAATIIAKVREETPTSLTGIPSFLSHFVQPRGMLLYPAQIASKTLSGLIYPLKIISLIETAG